VGRELKKRRYWTKCKVPINVLSVKALPLMKGEWSVNKKPACYRSAGCEKEFIRRKR
jgi:hypothetical protein